VMISSKIWHSVAVRKKATCSACSHRIFEALGSDVREHGRHRASTEFTEINQCPQKAITRVFVF
jgi:hypothetical protein